MPEDFDLGVLFVLTLIFIIIFYFVQLTSQRLGIKDPSISVMIDALIAAWAWLYWPRSEKGN